MEVSRRAPVMRWSDPSVFGLCSLTLALERDRASAK